MNDQQIDAMKSEISRKQVNCNKDKRDHDVIINHYPSKLQEIDPPTGYHISVSRYNKLKQLWSHYKR